MNLSVPGWKQQHVKRFEPERFSNCSLAAHCAGRGKRRKFEHERIGSKDRCRRHKLLDLDVYPLC
jgi:hypothetical protein